MAMKALYICFIVSNLSLVLCNTDIRNCMQIFNIYIKSLGEIIPGLRFRIISILMILSYIFQPQGQSLVPGDYVGINGKKPSLA